ncbi:hypothetical protein PUN28_016005 [Cardiocondyla obscurior]|uniref:Secreted protein n=1 Tax=Cardiocondyla obscurior TaxID=286306 RepID=A0AAW2EVS9_9HYME
MYINLLHVKYLPIFGIIGSCLSTCCHNFPARKNCLNIPANQIDCFFDQTRKTRTCCPLHLEIFSSAVRTIAIETNNLLLVDDYLFLCKSSLMHKLL